MWWVPPTLLVPVQVTQSLDFCTIYLLFSVISRIFCNAIETSKPLLKRRVSKSSSQLAKRKRDDELNSRRAKKLKVSEKRLQFDTTDYAIFHSMVEKGYVNITEVHDHLKRVHDVGCGASPNLEDFTRTNTPSPTDIFRTIVDDKVVSIFLSTINLSYATQLSNMKERLISECDAINSRKMKNSKKEKSVKSRISAAYLKSYRCKPLTQDDILKLFAGWLFSAASQTTTLKENGKLLKLRGNQKGIDYGIHSFFHDYFFVSIINIPVSVHVAQEIHFPLFPHIQVLPRFGIVLSRSEVV